MVLSDFGPSLTRVLQNIYRMWYHSAKIVPVSQIIWRDNEYVPHMECHGASPKVNFCLCILHNTEHDLIK